MFCWQIILTCLVILCQIVRINSKPNIVILFADDLGYGDLEIYGHPTSSTPNLNKLAADGLRFTQFYSTSPVCSPSRASLLTGRYQTRSGIWPGVFEPNNAGGLPHNETTIARVLKSKGYATNIVGKWHLGVGKDNQYLPTHHGFDSYFGVPYSHDMCPCIICFYPDDHCWNNCDTRYVKCPLFANTTIIEQPVDLLTLDERYTQHANNWISEKSTDKTPFFLYLAFQHTHRPNYASKPFRNSTLRGTFGDSLLALDWTVGEVIKQLNDSGVLNNTFVFFTSDNGPSLHLQNRGGNAGTLKCGKGTTYEGGQRVPAIAHWPGSITPGITAELASTLDIFPTIANLVGAAMPNVTIDGIDMAPILFKNAKSQRESFIYYNTECSPDVGLYAVRYQQYKAHYITEGSSLSGLQNHDPDCRPTANRTTHDPPLLYNLNQDPGEQYQLNHTLYQDILNTIGKIKNDFESQMVWGKSQMAVTDINVEPCCNKGCTPLPECCQCGGKSGKSNQLWDKYSRKLNGKL